MLYMKQSIFPSCCQLMKHLCTTKWLEKNKVRRFAVVKKKSPSASVKDRLSNLKKILGKIHYQR